MLRNGTQNLANAGLINPASGLGTFNDKSQFSYYLATVITSKYQLETTYVQSWAAKRYIDILPDHMLQKLRQFDNLSQDQSETYQNYLDSKKIDQFLLQTLKAARLTGSAFMIFVTLEAPLDQPLNYNLLQTDDLDNVLVFDRFSVHPNLADEFYYVYPRYGQTFKVHKSRVLRIDGIQPLVSDGWEAYDIYYGVSELLPVFQDITQSDQVGRFAVQMLSEASISVFTIKGMKAVNGMAANGGFGYDAESASIANTPQLVDQQKSLYNGIFLDAEDSYDRVNVNLGGVAPLLDAYADRLAAAAGIPATIFLGTQPRGFNATGESDLRIFADKIAAKQQKELSVAYNFIDKICSVTGGLNIKPTFTFPPLYETSETLKAEVLSVKSQALTELVQAGVISTNEAREGLKNDLDLSDDQADDFDFTQAFSNALDAQQQTPTKTNVNQSLQSLQSFNKMSDTRVYFEDTSYTPPKAARENAKKVLRWRREKGDEVDGMTSVGWARARQLASGKPVSLQTVKRMAQFARHRNNAKINLEFVGKPWKDKGYVAWLGWGGDEGIAWAKRISERSKQDD